MDKELQIFNYEGNEVRTIQKDGETWWVLKDVCDILGLSNPTKVAQRLYEDERSNFELGSQGKTNVVNEFGLYNVILRSDKDKAKNFKRKLKILAKHFDIEQHKILSNLYLEISDRYDIDINDYRADYCYINNVNQCSMLKAIESNQELRNYFETVLDEILHKFGLYVDNSIPKRKTVFDDFIAVTAGDFD